MNTEEKETFTDSQIVQAISQFLEYAESEEGKSQQGYFSGNGWAARCLRFVKDKFIEDDWVKGTYGDLSGRYVPSDSVE